MLLGIRFVLFLGNLNDFMLIVLKKTTTPQQTLVN
jgi:hypothetical protein